MAILPINIEDILHGGALYERANQIPFDDQINHNAKLGDLNLTLIREFLSEIKSDLASHIGSIPLKTLYRNMQIARGPEEHLMPINVGLMMFCNHPEIYFPYTQIDVVEFRDAYGDSFSEKIFNGPIHEQLSKALRYIQSMYIREEVRKIPNQAEALRFYNFPFLAIKESLANAVYHRGYQKREPIEVRIYPDRIEIQSFPGPLPPITIEELNEGRQIRVREYRNRRIGDFLKELHLTEGRCTGIPKIQRSMRNNGSSEARFETDEERTYFLTTLPIHPLLNPYKEKSESLIFLKSTLPTDKSTIVGPQSTQLESLSTQPKPKSTRFETIKWPASIKKKIESLGNHPQRDLLRQVIVDLCRIHPLSATEIAMILNKKSKKALVRDHLTPMKNEGILMLGNPQSGIANQRYSSGHLNT